MTLFCVGDADQLLYRFQGARPELLANLGGYLPNIKIIKLEINYRSNDEIIDTSQELIKNNYSGANGPYSQEMMKNANGIKGIGGSVQFNMYNDAMHEAFEVANTINELLQSGYNSGDFFIGARTRAQLGYLEGALVRAGIKFINITGGSFWGSKHVADVIAYLRLAYDTNDSEALKRIYNIPSANHVYTWDDKKGKFKAGDYCPTRYLGAEFLAKIRFNFNNIDDFLSERSAWRYQTNPKDYPEYGPTKAQDLQEFVSSLQELMAQSENVGQIIRVIIDDCYDKYLRYQGDNDEGGIGAKLEDLATVEELASQYNDPAKFLAYVDEMIKAANDAKDKEWGDYTVIATYHALKGLERPVVFGLGWCEGINVETGDLAGLLPFTYSLTDPPQFGVLPSGSKSPIEDERCIGFVCISRAIERCYLSGIASYRSWIMEPSRFIREIGLPKDTEDEK